MTKKQMLTHYVDALAPHKTAFAGENEVMSPK